MSCFNYLSPEARKRFLSGEAQAEKLSWFPPQLLITDRQAKRMARLARSDKVTDRIVAAGNPSTPRWALSFLATDPEYQVRSWVIRNPSLHKETIRRMQGDEDPRIAAYAKVRLELLVKKKEEDEIAEDHRAVPAPGGSVGPHDGGADEGDPPRE